MLRHANIVPRLVRYVRPVIPRVRPVSYAAALINEGAVVCVSYFILFSTLLMNLQFFFINNICSIRQCKPEIGCGITSSNAKSFLLDPSS
jgi:hypothetical protein